MELILVFLWLAGIGLYAAFRRPRNSELDRLRSLAATRGETSRGRGFFGLK
jgi:hypothetical protein